MDWLKRLIADSLPREMVPATREDDSQFRAPVAPIDITSDENTGFRNLLSTINMNRDPQSGELDMRRVRDNQSFEGMNEQPFNLPPRLDMMPEQKQAIQPPLVQEPPKMQRKPATAQPPMATKVPDEMPAKAQEDQVKPDILAQLGLTDLEPRSDDEMDAALKAKNDNQMLFAMNKAFNQIGSGIGLTKADPTHGDFLKDMVDTPVKDLQTKRASAKELEGRDRDRQKFIMDKADFKNRQEMSGVQLEKAKMELNDDKARSDANSDASKLTRQSTRDALLRMGRKDLAAGIKDNMSAEQLTKLFGSMSLANMLSAYEGQQNRLHMAKMATEAKADAKVAKDEGKKEDFITQRYDKIAASKPFQAMSKITQARRVIDDALNNPSGIKDIGALYSVIKLYDPDSVVREGEIKLTEGAKSVWGRAATAVSKAGANPRVLDRNVLLQMKHAADTIYGEAMQDYSATIDPVIKQAKQRGISDDRLNQIDPLYDVRRGSDLSAKDPSKMSDEELKAEAARLGIK